MPLIPDSATNVSSLRVEYGDVFNKSWVVDLLLDLCDYRPDLHLTKLRVVEPSVGSGAFVGPRARSVNGDSYRSPAQ